MVLKNAPKNVMVLRNAMLQPHPEKRYGAQKRARPHTHTHTCSHTRTRTRTLANRFTLVLVSITSGTMRNLLSIWKLLAASGSEK